MLCGTRLKNDAAKYKAMKPRIAQTSLDAIVLLIVISFSPLIIALIHHFFALF
jgi:hypothetical protein